MSAKKFVASVAAISCLLTNCTNSGKSSEFRVEAAILNSELQIFKPLQLNADRLPQSVTAATECNKMSGISLPLRSYVSWSVPNADLSTAQSGLKSELRDRGYRVVQDYERDEDIGRTFAEFEREAGEGKRLKAFVRIIDGSVNDVVRLALEVSPSLAC